MKIYCEKAQEVAEVFQTSSSVTVVPTVPQTNMMHLIVRGDLANIEARFMRIAKERKVYLFKKFVRLSGVNQGKLEVSIGDAALNISRKELLELVANPFGDGIGLFS